MYKNTDLTSIDLPWHYTVRRSGRAKRIRLSFTPSRGLELVLPSRAPLAEGLAFLATQNQWIESLSRQYQADLRQPPAAPSIPRVIELKATGERFAVRSGERLGLQQSGINLWLKASADQAPLLLQRWMVSKAHEILPPWLQDCAEHAGLEYSRVGIRNQSSRWGSYSSRGAISLNCRLLLLQPDEVEYVLLHELCHSIYMDHSAAFWRLLESVCPRARYLDRAVDEAAKQVPDWICFKPKTRR